MKQPDTAVAPAEAGDAGDTAKALIGTKWTIGEYEATFKDDKKVTLKGGALKLMAPNGLDADYTLVDGVLTVSAMGQKKEGTWDGTKLVVDGAEGVKLQ